MNAMSEVDRRLVYFVENFVFIYERALSEYYIRLRDDVRKSGKTAGVIASVIECASGIVELAGLIPDHTCAAQVINAGGAVGLGALKKIVFGVGASYNRKKLKKLLGPLYVFKEKPEDVRKNLVSAGVTIFQSYECQFMQATADGSWQRAMDKLADDGVKRVIEYYKAKKVEDEKKTKNEKESKKNEKATTNEEDFCPAASITKAVMLGGSKRDYFRRKGHTLQSYTGSTWSTTELFEGTGVLKIRQLLENLYYERKDKKLSFLYGFRLSFEWEDKKVDEKVKWGTDEMELPGRRVYKKVDKPESREQGTLVNLTPEEIEANQKVIFDKINGEDPKKKVKRMEERLTIKLDELKNLINECIIDQLNIIMEELIKLDEIKNDTEILKSDTGTIIGGIQGIKNDIQKLKPPEVTKKPLSKWWPEIQTLVDGFVPRKGKEKLIADELHRKINGSGQAVISGLPGTGKTTTARWFANLYEADYDHILWIDSEQGLELRFKEIATKLNIPITNKEKTSRQIRDIVIDIYTELKESACLFIFDNAEDYRQIEDFLPNLIEKKARWDILITSHSRYFFNNRLHGIDLSGFSPEEATTFIKNSLAIDINDTTQDIAIKELAEKLEYLPLALTIAVGSMRRKEKMADYVKLYTDSEKEATKLMTGTNRSGPYRKSVVAAFKVAMNKIKNEEEEASLAEALLNSMAYCNADDIPKEMFLPPTETNVKEEEFIADLQAEKDLDDALDILESFSLLRVHQKNDSELKKESLSMHRLVQKTIQLNLKHDKKEKETIVNLLHLLQMPIKKLSANVRYSNRRYIPHALSVWAAGSQHCQNSEFVTQYKSFAEYMLVKAAEFEHEKLLKWLLKEGVNVNAHDQSGFTALHEAAANGKVDCVKALIEAGAELNAQNSNGQTALHRAAFNGKLDCVKALIEAGADLNVQQNCGRTALIAAAASGKVDCVKALIEAGADLNAQSTDLGTALIIAVATGKVDFVKALIEAGADLNGQNCNDETALHLAANKGKLDCAKALIEAGADLNAQNGHDETALIGAAKNGFVDCVKALIEAGADLNAQDRYGETALIGAAKNGFVDLVKALIEAGADLNALNWYGETALHLVALRGEVDLVKALIKSGADLNAQNRFGETALHLVALRGEVDCVKALIEASADRSVKDKRGRTALDYARICNREDCVKYLGGLK